MRKKLAFSVLVILITVSLNTQLIAETCSCLGDVSSSVAAGVSDGKLDLFDITFLIGMLNEYGGRSRSIPEASGNYFVCGDIDEDGYVSQTDVILFTGWFNAYYNPTMYPTMPACPHSMVAVVPHTGSSPVTFSLEVDSVSVVGPGNTITVNIVGSTGSNYYITGFEAGTIVEAAAVDANGQATEITNMFGQVNSSGGHATTNEAAFADYFYGYLNNYQGCLFDFASAYTTSTNVAANNTFASFSYTISSDWDGREFYIAPLVAGVTYDYESGSSATSTTAAGYFNITSANDQVLLEGVRIAMDCIVADLNCDGVVNLLDFEILGFQWLQEPGTPSADIAPDGGDGIVDEEDLMFLIYDWLAIY